MSVFVRVELFDLSYLNAFCLNTGKCDSSPFLFNFFGLFFCPDDVIRLFVSWSPECVYNLVTVVFFVPVGNLGIFLLMMAGC